MFFVSTVFNTTDNLGFKTAKCIIIYKKKIRKNHGSLGNKILLSVRKKHYIVLQNRRLENQKLFVGVVSNLKYNKKRLNGHFFRFTKNYFVNAISLETYQGVHILKPLSKEIRSSIFITKMLQVSRGFGYI